MDWSYVSGFFDGEGNIHVNKITNKQGKIKSYQVVVRFYNTNMAALVAIRDFLCSGRIYKSKAKNTDDKVYELCILPKNIVKEVLANLQKSCIVKQDKIKFILENYDFGRSNNSKFDLNAFHALSDRKNVNKFYTNKEFI